VLTESALAELYGIDVFVGTVNVGGAEQLVSLPYHPARPGGAGQN
jgi:hypothetical protein